MAAYARQQFWHDGFVQTQVGDHAQPRLDLIDQVARLIVRGVRHVDRAVEHHRRHTELERVEGAQIGLQLGDEHVDTGGVLLGEFVWQAIPRPDEGQAVPVQPVGHCAVLGMGTTPVANGDPILVVADAIVVTEVELVDLHFVPVTDGEAIEAVGVPVSHGLHAGDHRLDTVLVRTPGRTVYTQRLPAPHPRCKTVEVRQIRVMVDVQMGQKDVIDCLERHLHGEDVAHAAGAEIEEEAFAIAQFDHNASARLAAGRWHGRTAEEGNAHLILAQLFGTGEVVVVIVQ
ncbi:hypothetical protein D3C78_938250 [compost metagenome]